MVCSDQNASRLIDASGGGELVSAQRLLLTSPVGLLSSSKLALVPAIGLPFTFFVTGSPSALITACLVLY